MMAEKFEPRQLSKVQVQAWQKLVASRRRLKVSALGKEWEFKFVLATSLPQNSIAADIRLGKHFGIIQCGFLPGARWLSELLRGPGIEVIQEPFRTAVIGVILQDFLQGLSRSSSLPLHLTEPNPSAAEQAITLYWQMVNDHEEAEIVGSLMAGEGLLSAIYTAAAGWPLSCRKLPDSLEVSVDVMIGSLYLSRKECSFLEVGDMLLLGSIERWRQESVYIRIHQWKQDGSLIPIKLTRSSIENRLLPKRMRLEEDESSKLSESNMKTDILSRQISQKNMPEAQHHENNETAMERASWTPSEGGEPRWMDSIEVILEFSLGRHTLSLGELKRLGQGHVFPIKTPENGFVDILLQGQSIGRGELARVGEEVGILVRELEYSSLTHQHAQESDAEASRT